MARTKFASRQTGQRGEDGTTFDVVIGADSMCVVVRTIRAPQIDINVSFPISNLTTQLFWPNFKVPHTVNMW